MNNIVIHNSELNQNIKTIRSLILTINPSILDYENDFFEKPFLINLTSKINHDQKVISVLEV